MRTEAKYKCGECEATFMDPDALEKHKRTHEPDTERVEDVRDVPPEKGVEESMKWDNPPPSVPQHGFHG